MEHVPFTWDPKKAAANLKQHGVSFEVAKRVFDDRLALDAIDDRGRTTARSGRTSSALSRVGCWSSPIP
jgi:uncharacterized DUF497 family protein